MDQPGQYFHHHLYTDAYPVADHVQMACNPSSHLVDPLDDMLGPYLNMEALEALLLDSHLEVGYIHQKDVWLVQSLVLDMYVVGLYQVVELRCLAKLWQEAYCQAT